MADDTTDFDALIDAAASGPAEVEVDGQRVRQQPLSELNKAADRAAAKNATRSAGFGIRVRRMIPPDTAT